MKITYVMILHAMLAKHRFALVVLCVTRIDKNYLSFELVKITIRVMIISIIV